MQPSLKLHKVHGQNSQVFTHQSRKPKLAPSNGQIRSVIHLSKRKSTQNEHLCSSFPIKNPPPIPPNPIRLSPTPTQLLFSSSSRRWSFASRASAVSASACARSWRLSARSAARSLARSAIASADISSAMGWVEKKRDHFKNAMVYHKMF